MLLEVRINFLRIGKILEVTRRVSGLKMTFRKTLPAIYVGQTARGRYSS